MTNIKSINLAKPVKLNLTIKTPLFIGTGETISRAEIAVKNKTYYRSDIHTIIKNENNSDNIINLFKIKNEKPTEPLPELEDLVLKYPKYTAQIMTAGLSSTNEFHEIIKTQNNLYIPGSTIKGAILSVIFNEFISEFISSDEKYEKFIYSILIKRNLFKNYKNNPYNILLQMCMYWLHESDKDTTIPDLNKIEKIVDIANKNIDNRKFILKTNKINKYRFKKWISVTDTNTKSLDNLGLFECRRIYNDNNNDSYLIENFELIKPETKFSFEISSFIKRYTIEELLYLISDHYGYILEKTENWLQKSNPNKNQDNFYLPTFNKNETPIRLGFGGSIENTTIRPAFANIYRGDKLNKILSDYSKNWELLNNNEVNDKELNDKELNDKEVNDKEVDPKTAWITYYSPGAGNKLTSLGWASITRE